jgi:MFS family permease
MGVAGSLFAFGGLWAVPFLRDVYGMERTAATGHTTLLLAGFALGAFFIGGLSDWFGRRKPIMVAAALVYCLCWLPLLLGWQMPSVVSHGLFLVMGLGSSSFTLTWSCAKEVNKHALSGMATSVVNTGGFLGTAMMQPMVGWAIDLAHHPVHTLADYQMGISILLGFSVMGLIATAFVRETYCQYIEDVAR